MGIIKCSLMFIALFEEQLLFREICSLELYVNKVMYDVQLIFKLFSNVFKVLIKYYLLIIM